MNKKIVALTLLLSLCIFQRSFAALNCLATPNSVDFSKAGVYRWYHKYFSPFTQNTISKDTLQSENDSSKSNNYISEEEKTNISNNQAQSLENEILILLNQERAKNGLSPLIMDEALSRVALLHSEDMASKNYFAHTNKAGLSPFDRLKSYGISYKTAGENIAMGYKDATSVVNGWMNSQGHRANILNKSFKRTGIGCSKNSGGKIYYTNVFTD